MDVFRDLVLMAGAGIVIGYVGSALIAPVLGIEHHAVKPGCPASCACICVSGKPVCKGNSGCPCSGSCPKPAAPKPAPSPLGFIAPGLNPSATTSGPVQPNTRPAKTAVPQKNAAPVNPASFLPAPGTGFPDPNLNRIKPPPKSDRHVWIGPVLAPAKATGFTELLTIHNKFGPSFGPISPVTIYSSGANDAHPTNAAGYKEAEIIFLATNGKPQSLCDAGDTLCESNLKAAVAKSGGNTDPLKLPDGIYATVNGTPTFKFNAQQVAAHQYRTRFDAPTRTYTLEDLTAKTKQVFIDKNADNTFSDTLIFQPANEWHASDVTGPGHVVYDIRSDSNQLITPTGNVAPRQIAPSNPLSALP